VKRYFSSGEQNTNIGIIRIDVKIRATIRRYVARVKRASSLGRWRWHSPS